MGGQLAVLSDIHGNRWALEAVLEDVRSRGIQRMVNLGDCAYGPLDPRGTVEILITLRLPTVRGNEDRILARGGGGDVENPSLDYTRASLSEQQRQWLHSLPVTRMLDDQILLCHGTPDRDDVYLLRQVAAEGVRERSAEEVERLMAPHVAEVLLCGHDHLPGVLQTPAGRWVVDPGSVGLPAFADSCPHPHVMEAGTPHARYGILEPDAEGWRAEVVTVRYDWEAAARQAATNGRADWARWLRSGRARA